MVFLRLPLRVLAAMLMVVNGMLGGVLDPILEGPEQESRKWRF